MAQDIRLIRGDSYDLEFEIKDNDGRIVPIATSGWKVMFESTYINKNSVDNPGDFVIEQGAYGVGQGKVVINASESDPSDCRKFNYKIKLYKDLSPTIVKTVVSGDMVFVNEAY